MPTHTLPERDDDGTFPHQEEGYPLYYITKDRDILCADCVNRKNGSIAYVMPSKNPDNDDPQWWVVCYGCHWEGPTMSCDHCNKEIESAYGDPDNPNED